MDRGLLDEYFMQTLVVMIVADAFVVAGEQALLLWFFYIVEVTDPGRGNCRDSLA